MELIAKLRYMGRQYANGQAARGGGQQKHYLEEAADEIEILRTENQRLKEALFFWLPNIPAVENECTYRMVNDAALLVGHEGRIDDSAEQRGWVTLTPNA